MRHGVGSQQQPEQGLSHFSGVTERVWDQPCRYSSSSLRARRGTRTPRHCRLTLFMLLGVLRLPSPVAAKQS